MRVRAAAVALGLGLTAVPVCAVEGWFRCREAAAGLTFPVDEPGRKYALRGGRADSDDAINAAGFNDDEFTVARPPGTLRVVLLGDSVTFGSGIKTAETYATVAEELLKDQGLPTEIYNLAIYGYDVEQVAATLHYVGWRYQPDLVVYAWFTNDAFSSELLQVDGSPVFVGTWVSAETAFISPAFTLWACGRSAIGRRWFGAVYSRQEEQRRAAGRRRKGNERYFAWWLDAMIADAKAHDTPLLVYGLGPHVLADPDLSTCGQPVRDGRYCASELATIRQAHKLAYARGLPFVSAVPWLQSGDEVAYWRPEAPDDAIHPSPEGHVLLARGLADLITRWKAGEDLLSPPEPEPPAPEPAPEHHHRRRPLQEVAGDPG